jgi:serine phosphatase RsbU (regulator of sigma subunit)
MLPQQGGLQIRNMKKNKLLFLTPVALVVALFLLGCGDDSSEQQRLNIESGKIINEAYEAQDYHRIIALADSLNAQGNLSEGLADFWLGYAYDRLMQKRMAELYWKKGISAVENSIDVDDVKLYAAIVQRLAGLLNVWGEYESAQAIVLPAIERMEKLKCDSTSDYANLLIYEGCYQSRFGISEIKADEYLTQGYRLHLDLIQRHHNYVYYRDAIIGLGIICNAYLDIHKYGKAYIWTERLAELIRGYEKVPDGRPGYAEKQWSRYYINSAIALEGLSRKREAAKAYQMFEETSFSRTAEGSILSSIYLGLAGRWQESADNFSNLNKLIEEQNVGYSLENIQKMLLKKFDVNLQAGRIDSAKAISMDIVQHLDSAITQARRSDAIEQEAVHQKEQEMAAEREQNIRDRQIGRLVMIAILIVFMLIYIVVRHRAQARLKKAHNQLKDAYDQLEATTTAKERMESELRIARNIQMAMLPSVFPEIDGIDMYASMTPAKEVGGDMYNYIREGNKLYFCIGDVSGKGVPASLFMAIVTRGFRTLALTGKSPAEIATRLNYELTENNDEGMFITMFICRLDLETLQLEYCNAGHNPPIIGDAVNQFSFLDVIPNAPIGLWPGLEYEGEEIRLQANQRLLLYTDGLNEAENRQQEQYGEDRIIQLLTSHSSSNCHDIIEDLKTDTDQFRDGAEQNDDLTMLAIKFS